MLRYSSFLRGICFFVTTIFFSSFILSDNFYDNTDDIKLESSFETKNSFISYVLINGKRYLVKQKKAHKKQIAVIRDALAAYIAQDLNIAHYVYIIPSDKKFPGKMQHSRPATLHTIAQGETVRKQRKCKYYALRIKQLWAQAQSFEEKGLTEEIIMYMTWHHQIPIIVALDLRTGNSDRHCGNICYDPEKDKFCAIDMDDSFNKDLCIIAYKKLKNMLVNKKKFTKEELKALFQMKTTLKFLVHRHTPQALIKKLHYFAKKAGFVKGNILYDDSIKRKIAHYESVIIQSNISAHRLIALLDKITK